MSVGGPAASHVTGAGTRLWEIDVARTLAIVMMVTYHVGYDVDFLAPSLGLEPREGWWQALQVATGSSFLVIAGISATIADAAAARRGVGALERWRRRALRGAEVLGFGLAISLVTWVALDDRYVRFGILHAIGASLVLAPLFMRFRAWNGLIGAGVVVAGLMLADERSDIPGLLVLGIRPPGGPGVDYYPLLPWFGLVLIGIAAASILYPDGRRGPLLRRLHASAPSWLGAPGRHALPLYLVHQPILIVVIAGTLALAGADWAWPD